MFWQLDGCSGGVSNNRRRCVNDSFACCWNSSLSFRLPCSASTEGLYLTFCILFYPVWLLSLGGLFFLKGNRDRKVSRSWEGGQNGEGKLCLSCTVGEKNLF